LFELKGKHDDGRIDVGYEVDTNRAGDACDVRLTDKGVTVLTRTATTSAPERILHPCAPELVEDSFPLLVEAPAA
jgi:hypothetical protein